MLNGVAAPVSQAGITCRVEISPLSQSLESPGGGGTVQVTSPGSCAWNASSSAPWLTITSGAAGAGNGTVSYSVSANTGVARLAVLTIADQTFAVTQSAPGAPQCNNTIQPASVNIGVGGGNTVVSVQADPSCSWTAASNIAWLAVVGVGVGSGNGNVTISASANTGGARIGTATIAGRTFTVNQAASCAPSLNPTSATLTSAGGAGPSVAVTIAPGCTWTASTTDSWLSITQGASGTGNGAVTFSAAANTGNVRTGSLTIGGQAFPVTQAGSCATSINSSSQSLPATAGNGTAVAVSAAAGCAWTATTAASWITITGGASGTGNGSVTFSVTANTGSARIGTISIGNQTLTVNQAGSCSTSIAPPSQSAPATAGAIASVTVTAPAGCNWTASSSQSWLTITSGASGSGNGTVALSVTANTGPLRSATVTISGQTHTVSQASGCTYALTPTSQSLNQNGQTAPDITVTTAAGCTWTVVSNDSWITVQDAGSGVGTDTVVYKVSKNNGNSPRVGTLTIAGRTFTVTQSDHEPEPR